MDEEERFAVRDHESHENGDSSGSELPDNIDIIDWIDEGPAFRYSDLTIEQKRGLIQVFERVGAATDVEWSEVRFRGKVDEPTELFERGHPNRDNPPLHPLYVQRPASEEVEGDIVIGPPGLAYPKSWHQGNWISVEENVLVDCAELESGSNISE